MKRPYCIPLLPALMAGIVPTSVLCWKQKPGLMSAADAAGRRVSTWPEWKRKAAEVTVEPDGNDRDGDRFSYWPI